MIRPVLAGGRAPAATAAILLVGGTLGGSFSTSGAAASAALVLVSGAAMTWALASARDGGGRQGRAAFRLAFGAFWAGAGFLSGAVRIARPAAVASATHSELPASVTSAAILEGTLADFWSGRPPRARSTLTAERIRDGPSWRPFPADLRTIEIGSYVSDTRRARLGLGWQPVTTFAEGIHETVRYYRECLHEYSTCVEMSVSTGK